MTYTFLVGILNLVRSKIIRDRGTARKIKGQLDRYDSYVPVLIKNIKTISLQI